MCNKEFLQIQTKDEASTETQPAPAELSKGNTHISHQALIPMLACFGILTMYVIHEFSQKEHFTLDASSNGLRIAWGNAVLNTKG